MENKKTEHKKVERLTEEIIQRDKQTDKPKKNKVLYDEKGLLQELNKIFYEKFG